MNAQCVSDECALHFATQNPHYEVVEALVNAPGADVNLEDNDHMTPLATACKRGTSPAIVKLLLDHDADSDRRDKDGWSPLMYASRKPEKFPGIDDEERQSEQVGSIDLSIYLSIIL